MVNHKRSSCKKLCETHAFKGSSFAWNSRGKLQLKLSVLNSNLRTRQSGTWLETISSMRLTLGLSCSPLEIKLLTLMTKTLPKRSTLSHKNQSPTSRIFVKKLRISWREIWLNRFRIFFFGPTPYTTFESAEGEDFCFWFESPYQAPQIFWY